MTHHFRLPLRVIVVAAVALLGGCQAERGPAPAARTEARENQAAQSQLSDVEAETAALKQEAERLRAERERMQAENEAARAEAEQLQKLIERARAEREAAASGQSPASSSAPAAPPAEKKADEPPKPANDKQAADKQKEEVKKARERERKLERLESDVSMARLRLDKARLARDHEERQFAESADKAERELAIARNKFAVFQEVTAPNRIARSELGLQMTEDGFHEAEEELDQLDLMYSEDQFADKTKEIVIDRARRRLERSQRDLDLRGTEHETLVSITIPQETTDQELDIQQKERGLDQLRRGHATNMIEQRLGVMGAEAEIVKLENELADVREEIADAKAAAAEQGG